MGEIALPDPSPVLDLAKIDVGAVLVRLEKVDNIAEAEEYRRRAQALASYLADRDPGPANRIANMAAVRIGELLGPAEMGKPSQGKLSLNAIKLDPATRNHFRLMAEYRSLVEEMAELSRKQILGAIDRLRREEERRLAEAERKSKEQSFSEPEILFSPEEKDVALEHTEERQAEAFDTVAELLEPTAFEKAHRPIHTIGLALRTLRDLMPEMAPDERRSIAEWLASRAGMAQMLADAYRDGDIDSELAAYLEKGE